MNQSITAVLSTMTRGGSWVASVTDIVKDKWGEQGWRFLLFDQVGGIERVRAGGIERVRADGIKRLIALRYPDFGDRMCALADLIVAVAPLLATPGSVADVEYQEHLLAEMHRLLPFLDEPVREALARRLIAAQHGTEAEGSELVSADQSA